MEKYKSLPLSMKLKYWCMTIAVLEWCSMGPLKLTLVSKKKKKKSCISQSVVIERYPYIAWLFCFFTRFREDDLSAKYGNCLKMSRTTASLDMIRRAKRTLRSACASASLISVCAGRSVVSQGPKWTAKTNQTARMGRLKWSDSSPAAYLFRRVLLF